MLEEVKSFLDEIYENPTITVKNETNKYCAKIGDDEILIEKYNIKNKKEELVGSHTNNPAFLYKIAQTIVKMFNAISEPCLEITREFSDDFSLYYYDVIISSDKIKIIYTELRDNEWTELEKIEFDKSPELLVFFKTIVSEIELME